MNWKVWLQGLGAAAIGGAVTTATQVVSAQPGIVQPKQIGVGAAMGALVTTLAYLTKSPISGTGSPSKDN